MSEKNIAKAEMRKVLTLSAFLFLSFLFACKEDGEVVPDFNSSNLNFGDTIILASSSTVAGDSVNSFGTSRSLLGKINDLEYGLSTSEIFAQFLLPSSSLNIPDEITFDSIILYLAYDDFFGFPYDQEVSVYELTENMSEEEYYSNRTIAASSELLGSSTLKIATTDTFGDSTYVLRIALANELATRIKTEGGFSSQTVWLDFFKGMRITTDPAVVPGSGGEGAIVYFSLLNSKTSMRLYYQDNGETTFYDFKVNSESKYFSHFENTPSSSLESALGKEDLEYNYIYAMAGTRTKITFPNLSSIAGNKPIFVNKAELIIPYEEPDLENYPPPDRNVIILKNDDNNWILPNDFFTGGTDYFGGSVDIVNKQYSFNLASTLNDMINKGDFDKELYLSVSGGAVTANRLKLNSAVNSKRKIYLILSFTKSN